MGNQNANLGVDEACTYGEITNSLYAIYHDNIIIKSYEIKDEIKREDYQQKELAALPNLDLNRNSNFKLCFGKQEHVDLLDKVKIKSIQN
jgi:hypothetical protein